MPKSSTGIAMQNSSDYVWDIYEPTPTMSTYLIAIGVLSSNYTYNTRQFGKRNISVISMLYDASTSERILTSTAKYLQFYEEYFNVTDELAKVDNLHAISGNYHAMENWGLIVYFQDHHKQLTIGHEVAHYWTGNKVTCSNWHE